MTTTPPTNPEDRDHPITRPHPSRNAYGRVSKRLPTPRPVRPRHELFAVLAAAVRYGLVDPLRAWQVRELAWQTSASDGRATTYSQAAMGEALGREDADGARSDRTVRRIRAWAERYGLVHVEHRRRKIGDEWRQLSNLTLWVPSPELLAALKAAGWTPATALTPGKGRPTPRAPQNQPRPPKDNSAGARFHEIDQARSQARAAELAGLPSPTNPDDPEDGTDGEGGRAAAADWLAEAKARLRRARGQRAGP